MPESVVVFLPIPSERASVASSLRPLDLTVTLCATERAAASAILTLPPPAAVVTSTRDESGRVAAPFMRWVRERLPAVPILAYGALSPQFFRDVVPAVRSGGLHAVALRDYDDISLTLADALRSARCRTVEDRAITAAAGRLSTLTRPIMRQCLRRADTIPRVERIAASFGVTRKTIASRLAAEELPPASQIIGWGRVLQAARLLEDRGRSVEEIALALDFDSGTALRHMLRRYTGMRPTELRAQGGLAAALPRFIDALQVRPRSVMPRVAAARRDAASPAVTSSHCGRRARRLVSHST
jgi:AraC-like DNA-binding protein